MGIKTSSSPESCVLVVVARIIFFCFGAAFAAKTFAVPNASNAAIINVIITLLFLNIFMITLLYIVLITFIFSSVFFAIPENWGRKAARRIYLCQNPG